MGLPYAPYSLSGEFSKMGYLVIIFVMYLGKHRGMPSVESAVVDFSHPALVEKVEKAEKAGALAHAQASAQPGDSAKSEAGEDYWNQASFREGSGAAPAPAPAPAPARPSFLRTVISLKNNQADQRAPGSLLAEERDATETCIDDSARTLARESQT